MDKKLVDYTLVEFCQELGSSSPAPGGGSTGALTASLGAALVSMVANLTIGKKKYSDVEESMIRIKQEATNLLSYLLELVDEDTIAFNKVMDAFRMPKKTQTEKELRKNMIQQATIGACEVPLKIAKYSVKVASISNKVARFGNKNAITDAGVAARLAEASYYAGMYNIKINLASIKDEKYVLETNEVLKRLLKQLEEAVMPVYEICDKL